MKKKHLLPSIAALTLSTFVLLIVIFVRNYVPSPKPIEPNMQEGQVAENETNEPSDIENPEDSNLSENTESPDVSEEDTVQFVASDKSYFDDALFIGDSRTVGIYEYGDMGKITFFATEGMSVYRLWKDLVPVKAMGSNYLEPLIKAMDYKKIYIMIGINELGYDREDTLAEYKKTLDRIHEYAPDAIIYICSNLHVTASQSAKSDIFNNENINNYNEGIKAFADNETFYYLEVNQLFDDGYGNLREDYTADNIHILAKYYAEWAEWFAQNTIVKE